MSKPKILNSCTHIMQEEFSVGSQKFDRTWEAEWGR